eukprot:TRINITY_DN10083_c0_g1_i2.p1 TRINITY_DN10083_c0_g1~~TRINITY_DN10083_c0_g1_i2.p1  ORF type:complete len:426 (+),score=72.56 TRINITY_DN10083_c0_g1_i2:175-1452(+)
MQQIVEELAEYVRDIDAALSKQSVQGISRIAIRIPRVAEYAIQNLLGFLSWDMEHVTAATVIAMKDVIRRYPDKTEVAIEELSKHVRSSAVKSDESTAAVVWMLGEYGDKISESPYMLEELIDAYDTQASSVKQELLSATMKLFFKRPGACQPVLGKLLAKACDDVKSIDVRDKGLLYYRMLKKNLRFSAAVVSNPKATITAFAEDVEHELNDQIFEEFNTFSVVYGMPADRFIKKAEDEDSEDERGGVALGQREEEEEDDYSDEGDEGYETYVREPIIPALVDAPIPQTATNPPLQAQPVALRSQPQMQGSLFQQKWQSLPVSETWDILLSSTPSSCKEVESYMASKFVLCIASGLRNSEMKFFFYAQEDNTSAFILIELVINIQSRTLSAKFKSETQRMLAPFVKYFQHNIGRVVGLRQVTIT